MIAMNTGSAQLNNLVSQRFVGCKVEFARAVVSGICRSCGSSLQTIGADNLFGRRVLDDQVIADGVEFIGVEPCEVRGFQTLLQFKVEDYETQTESCLLLPFVGCQA